MADPTGFAATTSGTADPDAAVCPLLAVELAAGSGSGEPGAAGGPDAAAAGRCTATSPAPAISAAQRRLVCGDAGHVDCPRYVRAMKGSRGPAGTRGSRGPAVPAAVAVTAVTAAEPAAPAGVTGEAPAEAMSRDEPAAVPSEVPTPPGDEPLAPAPAAPPAGPDAAVASPLAGSAPATVAGSIEDPAVDPAVDRSAAGPVAGGSALRSAIAPPDEPTPSVGEATPTPVPVRPMTRSSRRSGARPAGSRQLPIVIAGAILVVCLVIAFAFTSLRGGLALPGASPAGGGSPGIGLASPDSSAPASVAPSPSLALASPSFSPSPEPTPTATPSPSPSPTASLPAAYAGLKPCSDRAACYLYRIRSGDSLTKIADRFGLTLAVIKKANPEIKAPSLLHVGDVIRVPLPTR